MDKIERPRYELLDGLRGVAAMIVIWYHFFEGYATSPVTQNVNHGYLAVDFFFVLSGFVIGYAYDNRWNKLTPWRFMLRRVIRLHPMVVLAVLFGAIAWLFQGSVHWDGTPVPLHNLLIALVFGLFLIPVLPGMGADVRGNGEMFPLNGPSWSLFFEYIGSFLYAFILHKLSNRKLLTVTIVSGIMLAACAFGNMSGFYNIGFGWTAGELGWIGGFFRLSFSFSAGLYMQRVFKHRHIPGAFWICSVIIIMILICPYITLDGNFSPLNSLYDIVCTLFVFPAIVYIGACGNTTDRFSTRVCDYLGQLSYPIYIIHYPIMYLLYAWLWANGYSFSETWGVCAVLFVVIIALAMTVLRFYDEPVRRYLTNKFIKH